jgi:hypothetical protein
LLRPKHSPAIFLASLGVVGCGGDDVTAPSIPVVSGVYDVTEVDEAPRCDPASAAEPLDPAMGHGTFQLVLQVDQQGAQLTITLVEFNGHPPNGTNGPRTATIDRAGAIHIEAHETDQPTIFGVGTFVQEISSSLDGQFDTTGQPIRFSSTSETTFVFRAGNSSAPVFATCTQSGTDTGTRRSS